MNETCDDEHQSFCICSGVVVSFCGPELIFFMPFFLSFLFFLDTETDCPLLAVMEHGGRLQRSQTKGAFCVCFIILCHKLHIVCASDALFSIWLIFFLSSGMWPNYSINATNMIYIYVIINLKRILVFAASCIHVALCLKSRTYNTACTRHTESMLQLQCVCGI